MVVGKFSLALFYTDVGKFPLRLFYTDGISINCLIDPSVIINVDGVLI